MACTKIVCPYSATLLHWLQGSMIWVPDNRQPIAVTSQQGHSVVKNHRQADCLFNRLLRFATQRFMISNWKSGPLMHRALSIELLKFFLTTFKNNFWCQSICRKCYKSFSILIYQHIEVVIKLPTFRERRFQMHFLVGQFLYIDSNVTKNFT